MTSILPTPWASDSHKQRTEIRGSRQPDRLLALYLRDHAAAGAAGVRLFRRAARQNRGTQFEQPIGALAAEIEDDLDTLHRVLANVGVRPSKLKGAIAVIAERLSRLKMNGYVLNYSPSSRVLETEGMIAGVTAKIALWETLRQSRRTASFDFEALADRARQQRQRLETLHGRAVESAFRPSPGQQRWTNS